MHLSRIGRSECYSAALWVDECVVRGQSISLCALLGLPDSPPLPPVKHGQPAVAGLYTCMLCVLVRHVMRHLSCFPDVRQVGDGAGLSARDVTDSCLLSVGVRGSQQILSFVTLFHSLFPSVCLNWLRGTVLPVGLRTGVFAF